MHARDYQSATTTTVHTSLQPHPNLSAGHKPYNLSASSATHTNLILTTKVLPACKGKSASEYRNNSVLNSISFCMRSQLGEGEKISAREHVHEIAYSIHMPPKRSYKSPMQKCKARPWPPGRKARSMSEHAYDCNGACLSIPHGGLDPTQYPFKLLTVLTMFSTLLPKQCVYA